MGWALAPSTKFFLGRGWRRVGRAWVGWGELFHLFAWGGVVGIGLLVLGLGLVSSSLARMVPTLLVIGRLGSFTSWCSAAGPVRRNV